MQSVLFASLAIGCGHPDSASKVEDLGGSGSHLEISPGVTVSSGSYTVTNSSFVTAGTMDIGNTPDVPIELSALPLGFGYRLDAFALASDGQSVCEGSTTFDVLGSETSVTVHLTCGIPVGELAVSATLNVCPVFDGLDVNPNEIRLLGTSSLTATAHDPDSAPAPTSFKWTINGVAVPQHPAPTLSFTCTRTGTVNITSTVTDGDPTPGCSDSASTQIVCSP